MRAITKTSEVPTFEGIIEFIAQISKFKKYRNTQPRYLIEWDRGDIDKFLQEVPRENTRMLAMSNINVDETPYYTYLYSPLNYVIFIREKND